MTPLGQLMHDTMSRHASLKRAIQFIKDNYTDPSNVDFLELLEKMKKVVVELEGVMDAYYIDNKK